MQKIKIAFLIDTIDYQFGGTETQLVMLLRRLDRERFEPCLCCLQDSPWLQANRDICPIHVLGVQTFFSPLTYLRIWSFSRFLRANRIDILQSHFRDSNIVATLAAIFAGTRVLIATRRNQGYWHNRVELALLRLLNPFANYFLVNAEAIRQHVEHVEGVPSSKIVVVYNGLPLAPFQADREQARREVRTELEIDTTDPVIVLVANLRPVKGIEVFARAARHVTKKIPNARFLVVGEGPERENLTRVIESLGLKDSFFLLGKREDISRILLASDIGALCSHSEGLSNAIIECMAAGLPMVSTNVGGNPELVHDGVTGYLVPANDDAAFAGALLRLLEQPGQVQAMGQHARARAFDLFNVDRCVERTQSVYQTAIDCSHKDVER